MLLFVNVFAFLHDHPFPSENSHSHHSQQPHTTTTRTTTRKSCIFNRAVVHPTLPNHPHQVTNPPIDPIREALVTSTRCMVGPEGDITETHERQAHRLELEQPILLPEELQALKSMDFQGWRTKVIDVTWPVEEGVAGLPAALHRIRAEAQQAVVDGFSYVVLSDRAAGRERVAIPALLACGAVHHHLVSNETRTRVGLLIEAGDAHKVHDFCCLIGFGADAICPYIAMEAVLALREDGRLASSVSGDEYLSRYIKGINGGVLKVMSKMGISTIASYKGAQIFEALGLAREVIQAAFVGTASRIAGVDLATVAADTLQLHAMSYGGALQRMSDTVADAKALPDPGDFHYRSVFLGGGSMVFVPLYLLV